MLFKQEQTSECTLYDVQLTNIYIIYYLNQSFICLDTIFPRHWDTYTIERLGF